MLKYINIKSIVNLYFLCTNESSELTCAGKSISAESIETDALVAAWKVIAGSVLAAVPVVLNTLINIYSKSTGITINSDDILTKL